MKDRRDRWEKRVVSHNGTFFEVSCVSFNHYNSVTDHDVSLLFVSNQKECSKEHKQHHCQPKTGTVVYIINISTSLFINPFDYIRWDNVLIIYIQNLVLQKTRQKKTRHWHYKNLCFIFIRPGLFRANKISDLFNLFTMLFRNIQFSLARKPDS